MPLDDQSRPARRAPPDPILLRVLAETSPKTPLERLVLRGLKAAAKVHPGDGPAAFRMAEAAMGAHGRAAQEMCRSAHHIYLAAHHAEVACHLEAEEKQRRKAEALALRARLSLASSTLSALNDARLYHRRPDPASAIEVAEQVLSRWGLPLEVLDLLRAYVLNEPPAPADGEAA